jgi:hypothetical protein
LTRQSVYVPGSPTAVLHRKKNTVALMGRGSAFAGVHRLLLVIGLLVAVAVVVGPAITS